MACAAASLLFCVAAPAQQYSDQAPLPTWYVGPSAGLAIPDGARESDNGTNFGIIAGRVFADALSVEVNLSSAKFDSNVGGPETELTGYGVDLVLGLPDYGSPAFLLGFGSMSQKIGSQSQSDTYGNLGLGLYMPFSFGGELWRLEGRYQPIFADEVVEDVRVNMSVLFTFGRKPPPAPEAPVEVADEDADGVGDGSDRCPGTPKWVRPDAFGCTPDSDGDGVDDSRDDCPEGGQTGAVDANGCEAKAQPSPNPETLAPDASADADHDGVADTADTCPHTGSGLKVDANGCVEPEAMMMGNLHFDTLSSRLTGDGYTMLRAIAAALKSQPAMTLEVGGHADSTGGPQLNRDLSLERAEAARDFLTYLGISESRLTVKAYGESQPLKDNASKENRAYNRRVQFRRTDQ
jgi:OOP family OmpA-OmpF porin